MTANQLDPLCFDKEWIFRMFSQITADWNRIIDMQRNSLRSWQLLQLILSIMMVLRVSQLGMLFVWGVSWRFFHTYVRTFWFILGCFRMNLLLSIFLIIFCGLLGGIVYVGTFNHNLSFKVNLFSFFSWLWLKILLGEYFCSFAPHVF